MHLPDVEAGGHPPFQKNVGLAYCAGDFFGSVFIKIFSKFFFKILRIANKRKGYRPCRAMCVLRWEKIPLGFYTTLYFVYFSVIMPFIFKN